MKNHFIICLSALLLSAFTLFGAAEGVIKAEVLTIRAQPNTTSAKIGSLKRGDKITILAPANGWFKIKLPADTPVWVSASLVKDGKIAVRVANLRNEASTSSVVLGKAPNGASVEVLDDQTEGWLKIKCPANVELAGYVSAAYVTTDQQAGAEPTPSRNGNAQNGNAGNGQNQKSADGPNAEELKTLRQVFGQSREVTVVGYLAEVKPADRVLGLAYSMWEDRKGNGKDLRYMGLVFGRDKLGDFIGKRVKLRATSHKIDQDGWPPVLEVISVTAVR